MTTNNEHLSSFSVSAAASREVPTADPVAYTTIHWDGESYQVPAPRWCSFDECEANFEAKVRINEAIATAKENNNAEDYHKLQKLRGLLKDFLFHQYANKSTWTMRFRNLDDNDGGLYVVFYRKKDPIGGITLEMKIGMSMHCLDRVLQQGHSFAARIMSRDEIHGIVPPALVEQIQSLELPGLIFHDDHGDYLQYLIAMQICEMVHACCYECVTNTVCERFVELPSEKVQRAIAERTSFPEEHIDFLRGIPDGSIFAQLTWPTLISWLREMAKTSDFLSKKLRPEAPPEGGFVTLNRLMALLGSKLGDWEDSVDVCPRVVELRAVVATLRPLLESQDLDHAAIREALKPIQDDNYSSYVRPSTTDLAVGAQRVLQKSVTSRRKDGVLWIERETVKAMKEECGEWLQGIVDTEMAMEVTPERPGSLRLSYTRSGHRLVTSASFYIAFAENQSEASRFGSVQDFLATMDLLYASGNITHDAVSKNRKILRSYLMGLDRGDGNFAKSRILAFPKGWFRGSPRNILGVSKALGIGYGETLFIRDDDEIGEENFNNLLLAHGLLGNGQQETSPMEPTWKCGGVPAVLGRPAVACQFVNNNDDDDLPPNTCMVGAQQPNHVLRGLFLCQRCHRKIECREMSLLCDAESRGNITSPQKERKRVLEERQENKREWASAKRIKDVEQKGLLAVQETERAKNRNFQTSQSRAIEENPESLQKYKDDYKRQALKAKPKAKGFHRESKNKKVKYPPFFIDRLTEALRILIQLYGQEYLYWNDIVDLFDRFLKHEQPRLAMYNETLYVVKILPNGSPFPYLDLEYRRVANVLLQQSKTQPAKWKVRDYQPVSTSGKLRQDLNGDVFNAVYSAIASKEDEKPVELEPHFRVNGSETLSAKFDTITDMWNEWYGLQQFQDVPIVGGFQQLEALRGAEWRKQVYTSTETIRFSKIKRIIGAIKPEDTDRSLAVFNVVWVSVGKNLGNMVGELQKRGWIEKESRKFVDWTPKKTAKFEEARANCTATSKCGMAKEMFESGLLDDILPKLTIDKIIYKLRKDSKK